MPSTITHPKLRPIEVRASRQQPGAVDLLDRSGISQSVLTVSQPALFVVSRMDGRHSRSDIQAAYMLRHGQMLFSNDLDRLIMHLDEAMLLHGPRFEAEFERLTTQYRAAPYRALRDIESLGAKREELPRFLDDILATQSLSDRPNENARLRGIIAPHLDYARGAPCYAAAYQNIMQHCDARRFVILGTNHFGHGGSVVGTSKDFETPWGIVPCDSDFMKRIDARCGVELCTCEFDHVREHSIELQAILLRHALPNREFKIVSYLCPDPCGPSGTAPHDGKGVDLKKFAEALRDEIAADPVPTCLIASADLSHVGRFFQDQNELNTEYLDNIAQSDQNALAFVSKSDPEGFRSCVAATSNQTNICSVGCIYALATALRDTSKPQMLYYHQALIRDLENCVSSAAAVYWA